MENIFINQADSHLMVGVASILPIITSITDHSDELTINSDSVNFKFIDFLNNIHHIEIFNMGSTFRFKYNFTDNENNQYKPIDFYISNIIDGIYMIMDRLTRNIAENGINKDINDELYKDIIEYLDSTLGDNDYLMNIEDILLTIKSENMLDISENHIEKLKKANIVIDGDSGPELRS